MNAEIISIGDELLIGQTVNTNASFLGQKLTEIGIIIKWITTISDNETDILTSLKLAEKRSDIIITTGGLGPTHDDVTQKAFVKYFNSKLILNEVVLKRIKEIFVKRGIHMPKVNEKQALVPHNASILENRVGTAPGLIFEKNNKYFIVLPGVPEEMKSMTTNTAIPFLKKKSNRYIKQKLIKTTGIAESALFEKIGNVEELEQHVKIAFLPKSTGIEIRLTSDGVDEALCSQNISKVEKIIRQKVKEYIWGTDSETIEDIVATLLVQQQKTIALAESGSGGLISDRLTNIPQSSTFLKQAVITNSMESKVQLLGISKELIDTKGLVSSEVALTMAEKIRRFSDTTYGLATTDISETTDDMDSTPIILIYIAIADVHNSFYKKILLRKIRQFYKQRISQIALDLLRRHLLKA